MSRNPGPQRPRENGYGSYTNGNSREGGYGGFSNAEDERARNDYPRDDYGRDDYARDDYPQRPSAERRRRPAGYGAFDRNERIDEAPPVQRPTSLGRTSQTRRRSGERSGESAGRFGPGSQKMEEILQYIQQNWEFMTHEKCVPIEVSLKLMDTSSLGLADQSERFYQTHQELQLALKAIVNGRSAAEHS